MTSTFNPGDPVWYGDDEGGMACTVIGQSGDKVITFVESALDGRKIRAETRNLHLMTPVSIKDLLSSLGEGDGDE